MKLIIMRHAEAEAAGAAAGDHGRKLTRTGQADARRMARLLAATGWAVTRIRTSPLVRTRESGTILSEGLREFSAPDDMPSEPELITEERLAPGFDLDVALGILDDHASNDVAVWVFHAPDVQRLAAELIGVRESAFYFTPGSMLALNLPLPQPAGKAMLVWNAQPEYLRQLL